MSALENTMFHLEVLWSYAKVHFVRFVKLSQKAFVMNSSINSQLFLVCIAYANEQKDQEKLIQESMIMKLKNWELKKDLVQVIQKFTKQKPTLAFVHSLL